MPLLISREAALELLDQVDALFETDADAPGVTRPAFQLAYAVAKGDDFQGAMRALEAALIGIRLPQLPSDDRYQVTYLGDADTLPEGMHMVEYTSMAAEVVSIVSDFGGGHMVRVHEWNGDFYQAF